MTFNRRPLFPSTITNKEPTSTLQEREKIIKSPTKEHKQIQAGIGTAVKKAVKLSAAEEQRAFDETLAKLLSHKENRSTEFKRIAHILDMIGYDLMIYSEWLTNRLTWHPMLTDTNNQQDSDDTISAEAHQISSKAFQVVAEQETNMTDPNNQQDSDDTISVKAHQISSKAFQVVNEIIGKTAIICHEHETKVKALEEKFKNIDDVSNAPQQKTVQAHYLSQKKVSIDDLIQLHEEVDSQFRDTLGKLSETINIELFNEMNVSKLIPPKIINEFLIRRKHLVDRIISLKNRLTRDRQEKSI